jgi:MFS family permease
MDSLTPPSSLLRQRSFVLFWGARTSTNGAYQMQAVAVGWQLYDLTHDSFDLGLVGLMQFFPVVVFALVIGQIADHFDRRVIAGTCQVIKALAWFRLFPALRGIERLTGEHALDDPLPAE